jgi:hypothetical protein
MKTFVLLISCIFCCAILFHEVLFSQSQEEQPSPLTRPRLGFGVQMAFYHTSWYFRSPSILDPYSYNSYYPDHIFERTLLSGFFQTGSLFKIGRICASLRLEGQVGISSGTVEDWLPDGETISSGGATYAFAGLFYLSYPFRASRNLSTSFFAGAGGMYTILKSDGQNVGTSFANNSRFRYSKGWTETVAGLPLSFGTAIGIGKIFIQFEYRLLIAGGETTDWDPQGTKVEIDPKDEFSFSAYIISVGLSF